MIKEALNKLMNKTGLTASEVDRLLDLEATPARALVLIGRHLGSSLVGWETGRSIWRNTPASNRQRL